MNISKISEPEYSRLLDFINSELMKNGIKATTMDSIASKFKISKRTLYEIFSNKDEMIEKAAIYWHGNITAKFSEVFSSSSNILEAILTCFFINRDLIAKTNANFFKELHEFANKKGYHSDKKKGYLYQHIIDIIKKGIDEGYFRDDINFKVQAHLFTLQMEAMRSLVDVFPEELSPIEVYDSIILTFLRGISTPNGIETLDRIVKERSSSYHK